VIIYLNSITQSIFELETCFICGTNWILNYYLDVLRLQMVKYMWNGSVSVLHEILEILFIVTCRLRFYIIIDVLWGETSVESLHHLELWPCLNGRVDLKAPLKCLEWHKTSLWQHLARKMISDEVISICARTLRNWVANLRNKIPNSYLHYTEFSLTS
jgi:hypothetical protein